MAEFAVNSDIVTIEIEAISLLATAGYSSRNLAGGLRFPPQCF